jgi:TolA-binding protein
MRPWLYSLYFIPALIPLSGCSHGSTHPDGRTEMDVARDHILKLQEKVADLETRLTALNEKINLESGPSQKASDSHPQGDPPPTAPVKTLPTEVVSPPAAESKAIPKVKVQSKPTFASNESIDRFREAKILFDTKRYPDAVLEFSDFVKNEPDHVLAPAAQYYLGLSYLKQNEYKLAEEELSRGMLTYPHSAHIPDSLLALVEVSSALKKPGRVTYFKEKLQSQFPNSPQAKSLVAHREPVFTEEPRVIESKSQKTIDSPEAPTSPTSPSLLEGEQK